MLAAMAVPFLAMRSPGAVLLFLLLPAYAVLQRGDFSTAKTSEKPPAPVGGLVFPEEILARLAAACLAAAASFAAAAAGTLLARRFSVQTFETPWGFGSASAAASLLLVSAHLPALALAGRKAGRVAAGAVFALVGVLAAFSALTERSLYAAFLWLLYSGEMPSLYLPMTGCGVLLAGLSGAAAWGITQKKRPR